MLLVAANKVPARWVNAAISGIRHRDFTGLRFSEGDEFAHAAGCDARMHDEHEWRRRKLRDRRKAFDRIVAGLTVYGVIDCERRVREQQRISVVRRVGNELGCHKRGGTRTIVDDAVLTHDFRQLCRDYACNEVAAAARREWHHDANRSLGKCGFSGDCDGWY
jgi:hypothetical protein